MIGICVSKCVNPSPEEAALKDAAGNDIDDATKYWKDFIEKEDKENPNPKKPNEKVLNKTDDKLKDMDAS